MPQGHSLPRQNHHAWPPSNNHETTRLRHHASTIYTHHRHLCSHDNHLLPITFFFFFSLVLTLSPPKPTEQPCLATFLTPLTSTSLPTITSEPPIYPNHDSVILKHPQQQFLAPLLSPATPPPHLLMPSTSYTLHQATIFPNFSLPCFHQTTTKPPSPPPCLHYPHLKRPPPNYSRRESTTLATISTAQINPCHAFLPNLLFHLPPVSLFLHF